MAFGRMDFRRFERCGRQFGMIPVIVNGDANRQKDGRVRFNENDLGKFRILCALHNVGFAKGRSGLVPACCLDDSVGVRDPPTTLWESNRADGQLIPCH